MLIFSLRKKYINEVIIMMTSLIDQITLSSWRSRKMLYFTKSKFARALDCPTKLYYGANPDIYHDCKIEDPFLRELAKGGFQVGKLAQCYYPQGIEVKSKNNLEALKETESLLKREKVTIFEAAISFEDFLIRADILIKDGNEIKLMEVKSKSVNSRTFENEIWKKSAYEKGQFYLLSDWKPYIYDIAFQSYVAKLALPDFSIKSSLMLTDKTQFASIDGLNQKFFIKSKGRSFEVIVNGDVSPEALGEKILSEIDVTDIVQLIHTDQELSERFEGRGWPEGVTYLASQYTKNQKVITPIGGHCRGCEFRKEQDGKKSGLKECWHLEREAPLVIDVWNFRGSDKAIKEGKELMEDLDETDFKSSAGTEGLSNPDRQWLQVEKVKNHDNTSFIDSKGLKREFDTFNYPLHMIDFETCMVAVPFKKGTHPYEQIAFQFSHHEISHDGIVSHRDEYINVTPGDFPNFKFVRALKTALSRDQGTIFRYSNHENAVLNQIKEQLIASDEYDKNELIDFITSITDKSPRSMVDLCNFVKKYYYSPATNGSNSLKYVLPAILNESSFLKTKYSEPTYSSDHFKDHQWINLDENGYVLDPYKTLPPIFTDYDFETLENMMSEGEGEINSGGAALTAYVMVQFTQMSDWERNRIKEALLRYCELDTLAMVMLYEFWKSVL